MRKVLRFTKTDGKYMRKITVSIAIASLFTTRVALASPSIQNTVRFLCPARASILETNKTSRHSRPEERSMRMFCDGVELGVRGSGL